MIMKNWKYIFFAVILLVLVGIVYWQSSGGGETELTAVDFSMIDRGNYGLYGRNVSFENVNDEYKDLSVWGFENQADFKRFWENNIREANTGGFTEVPEVDFSKEFVLAFLQGIKTEAGYFVNVMRVNETNKALVVYLQVVEPGEEEAALNVVSSPYDVIRVSHSYGDVNNKLLRLIDDESKDVIMEVKLNSLFGKEF